MLARPSISHLISIHYTTGKASSAVKFYLSNFPHFSSLLKQSLANSFLELPEAQPEILAKIQSIAYERESFCGEASQAVVSKALRQFAFEGVDMEKGRYGVSPLRDPSDYFWDVEMLMNSRSYSGESLKKLRTANIPECRMKLDRYTYRTSYEQDAFVQVSHFVQDASLSPSLTFLSFFLPHPPPARC